ncbi:MAG: ankyrin repeat domain-containing protein [Akkermansiaceae bacterium]|nr:ankyrin repeat domain-containing protein [Akkermansiaceae bacterium]
MKVFHSLLSLLCMASVPSLWALGPANISGLSVRLDMSGAQIARSPMYGLPIAPWYTLGEVSDFVLSFPDSAEFEADVQYSAELSNEVTVSYHPNTKENQAYVKVECAELSVLLTLTYTSDTEGTAAIAWHEAGNTRHLRNIPFTVADDAEDDATVEFPEEIIGTSPENQLDDGLSSILREIEGTRYRSASERLYQKRLSSLLPMVMMLGNPSFTTPDYKGNTALHYACSLGHVALVRWLVDHGANLEARTEKGASIDACVGGGKNGEAIKGILQQARRERDYPLRGPQASEEEAARAVAWLEKAFRCEDVNSPLYEIPTPDATAQEHAETLFLYVRQNREIPPQVDVTEPLGNLLTWLRDANVHRGMFTEALQKELYQIRSYNLHQLQKAGKSLALLPHMILTREKEGMPFDGATAVYRAACEGNVELVRWLIGYGADRSLRDAEGNEVTLPENTPNAAEIEEALQMHD